MIYRDDTLAEPTAKILARVRARAPRVQCLTNTVGQAITANALLALGARVSMATHPDEVVAMTASADALLINLGTPDEPRLAAIPRLLDNAAVLRLPRVLDPVFVEHSPLRRALAERVIAAGPLIVKGNTNELEALALPIHVTRVETGPLDRITSASTDRQYHIGRGHRWMAQVTGLGCAAGAVIAAFAAVEADPLLASAAALLTFGIAGELAAARTSGPGTFAASFLDVLADLDATTLAIAVSAPTDEQSL